MSKIYESDVEEMVIKELEGLDYAFITPEEHETERGAKENKENLGNVILLKRLRSAIDKLNPSIPQEAREQAFKQIVNLSGSTGVAGDNLIESNETFHRLFTDGVEVEYQKTGAEGSYTKGDKVWLADFENPRNNDLVVCNQFTVIENDKNRRPDVVLMINGLPLVVIELKNPTDEQATVQKAFTQLKNYKTAISGLFVFNGVLVASDGLDAKMGSLTAGWSRFMAWKTVDGVREDKKTTPQIETLIKGMLRPDVLLDLVKQFTVFEKEKKEDEESGMTQIFTTKKIASYHQYHAINKAVESTIRATGETINNNFLSNNNKVKEDPAKYGLPRVEKQEQGDKKVGIIWHTQGSGKSLSMVFYAGKLIVEPAMGNATLVVITDRNDLDDQLFDTFAGSKQLLRQEPVQASNRSHLKGLLKTTGGGIIFTTIQKFSPEGDSTEFDRLSDRKNIVVIADEAHRSQYGFGAKTIEKKETNEAITKYGFAKYLRDALPNASFIGFTGTPIEKEDASTPAVFGNYIDVYDIQQAVEDGATVKIYYESRLAKVHLKKDEMKKFDEEVEQITENEETSAKEKAKRKWTQIEAIVGHKNRLKDVASDLVKHFEARQEVVEGKGMIVTMSRRIAVELYKNISEIRPEWHDTDKKKGAIKVIMTSSSSDQKDWQIHNTSKQDRKDIGDRLKDPEDPLKLVIVRDMWLTGFDAPCLHTMYVDKPMRGHNLMQAIARVNRVYKNKPGGLIVDYIGIASDLKKALSTYTQSGGQGTPTLDQADAIALMMEQYEKIMQMFNGFDYKKYFSTDTKEKMTVILEAQEFILGLEKGKDRFIKEVTKLSKAFALSIPSDEAMEIKEEVGFFQAVKARLVKFEPKGGKSDAEVETAIKQIVDKAVVAEGVIDIFDAAGIKKPNISILSDDFLEEVKGMKQKNVALELLKKLLNDEIKNWKKKSLIQSKKLSEMLEKSINKYQNNLLTTAQVIDELINLAKDMKDCDEQGKESGLTQYELAFYIALANNDSAKDVLGNETLRELAVVLAEKVKTNTAIDWTIKSSVQAKLRVIVKRILRKYGYPPDKQKLATDNILKEAEKYADEWSS